jgi:hypothetical protein
MSPPAPVAEQWLGELLGERGATITDWETHHRQDDDDELPVPVRGIVREIEAAFGRSAPRPGEDPVVHYPVHGSAWFETRDEADAWEGGSNEFWGYIVTLTLDGEGT